MIACYLTIDLMITLRRSIVLKTVALLHLLLILMTLIYCGDERCLCGESDHCCNALLCAIPGSESTNQEHDDAVQCPCLHMQPALMIATIQPLIELPAVQILERVTLPTLPLLSKRVDHPPLFS